MHEQFRAALPRDFVENVISLCGSTGDAWLNALPDIIKRLEQKWTISAGKHFRILSLNYVANAVLSDGSSAVLKIGLPLKDIEIFGEAAYLRHMNGDGAVQLLEFDREHQAILIERVRPGVNLRSSCKRDQEKAVEISIRTLQRIARPAPAQHAEFIDLDDWFDGLERAAGSNFPSDYSCRALRYYRELAEAGSKRALLHGDFHHDNILSAAREPYLVIDPKGMIGGVGYDIGVFLNNHRDWLECDTRLEGKLDKAVAQFAGAFGMDEMTIRKWAFCQMVLSWWWIFDEMPDRYGGELGLSDAWKV